MFYSLLNNFIIFPTQCFIPSSTIFIIFPTPLPPPVGSLIRIFFNRRSETGLKFNGQAYFA